MIVRAGARVDGLVTDKLIYGIRLEKHKNDKNDMMCSYMTLKFWRFIYWKTQKWHDEFLYDKACIPTRTIHVI